MNIFVNLEIFKFKSRFKPPTNKTKTNYHTDLSRENHEGTADRGKGENAADRVLSLSCLSCRGSPCAAYNASIAVVVTFVIIIVSHR